MMHFVFEAKAEETTEGTTWIAGWSGETPRHGVIVTESETQEGLAASVKDAIETFLGSETSFTFEIFYA